MAKGPKVGTIPNSLFRDQLVTIGDLEGFKDDLLLSLTRLIKENMAPPLKKWLKSYEVRKLMAISNGTLPFVLEFLNIPDPLNFREADLETSILNNLQQFILELGKCFSFVGQQYHINTETT
jgi:hypothetical protein